MLLLVVLLSRTWRRGILGVAYLRSSWMSIVLRPWLRRRWHEINLKVTLIMKEIRVNF